MGIKGLPGFLRRHSELYKTINLTQIYKGQILIIDTSIQMYQFKNKAVKKIMYDTITDNPFFTPINTDLITFEILKQFLKQVLMLLKGGILPIYILDGERPQEKKDFAHNERAAAKQLTINRLKELNVLWKTQNYTHYTKIELFNEIIKQRCNLSAPNNDDYNVLLLFFNDLNICNTISNSEADNLCAYLVKYGYAFGVWTIDSDMFAYNVPLVIYNIREDEGDLIALGTYSSDIYKKLNLTPSEFIDFCILCGTDYNKGIKGIGVITAYNLITNYKTLDDILTLYPDSNLINEYINIRNKFKNIDIQTQPHIYNNIESYMMNSISNSRGNININIYINKYEYHLKYTISELPPLWISCKHNISNELNKHEIIINVINKNEIIINVNISSDLKDLFTNNSNTINETENIINKNLYINESIINEHIINENIIINENLYINEHIINENIIINEIVINETTMNESIINENIIINETLL